jgi:hypothetical protein
VLDRAAITALGRSEPLGSLEVLDLGLCSTLGDHAHATYALPAFANLRELRCYGQAFGPRLAVALATGARALEVLDLGGVRLEEIGTYPLLRGATALPKLRRLDISGAGLSSEGFARLIGRLEVPGLRRLACGGDTIDERAVAALAASPVLAELQQLFLRGSPLGDAGVAALAASERLPALRVLDLSSTGCGPDGFEALGASELGARLVSLELDGHEIGSVPGAALRAVSSRSRRF